MASDLRDATLVLGGSGFLGAHVVSLLAAGGGEVWSASRDPAAGPLFGAGASGGGGVKLREVDGARGGEVGALLAEARPARVIACAALSRIEDCEASPERAFALNVRLPRAVAAWCASSHARLVHVSTDLVFGREPPPPQGFREEDPPAPVSEYGRSKTEGERRVLEACPAALVVRLPLLYGDSGGRGLGASDGLLAAIARGERPVLFADERRTPLEVGNAARALVELARSAARGILHVAGPERLSRLELGLRVLARAGIPGDRVRAGTRAGSGQAGRAADAALDSSRARALLATPLLGVREGLACWTPARGAEAR